MNGLYFQCHLQFDGSNILFDNSTLLYTSPHILIKIFSIITKIAKCLGSPVAYLIFALTVKL
jgi:hypothetical protein